MSKLYLFYSHANEDIYIGDIYFDNGYFYFEYSEEFLSRNDKFSIDPRLCFYSGKQYFEDGLAFIEDMIPDRFGKLLIDKKEAELAEKEKRIPHKMTSIDYLVRVDDKTRMGALRIKKELNGPFINDSKDAIPPYIYLRDIEAASIDIENNVELESKTLNRLLLPGSSLGGARPKANIYYND